MIVFKKLAKWIRPQKALPPPHPSVKRGAEIADDMARYSARIRRQS